MSVRDPANPPSAKPTSNPANPPASHTPAPSPTPPTSPASPLAQAPTPPTKSPAPPLPTSSKPPTPPPNRLRILFLSVLYSGRSPKAPGTVGTALGVLLGLPILAYSTETLFWLACLAGLVAVREIDKWESWSKKHDEKWIVIDELVGVWLAMAMVGYSTVGVALAFVSFRLFDIWKPSIIGRVDRRVRGGLGVVGDDVLAGLLAGVCSLAVLELSARFGLELRALSPALLGGA